MPVYKGFAIGNLIYLLSQQHVFFHAGSLHSWSSAWWNWTTTMKSATKSWPKEKSKDFLPSC